MLEYIVGGIGILAAGICQGCTGFGFALISVPVLMMVTGQTVAIPTVLALGFMSTCLVLLDCWRDISPRLVGPLIAGSLIGVPIGDAALRGFQGPGFRLAIGVLVFSVSAVLMTGWSKPIKKPKFSLVPIGMASGILSASTAIGGPPVILFLSNQGASKRVFRANIVGFLLMVSFFALSYQLFNGTLLNRDVATHIGVFFPLSLGGTFAGMRLSERVTETMFRRLTLIIAGAMGTLLILSNLPF